MNSHCHGDIASSAPRFDKMLSQQILFNQGSADAINQTPFVLLLTVTYGFPGIRLESLLVVDVMKMGSRLKWRNYEVDG